MTASSHGFHLSMSLHSGPEIRKLVLNVKGMSLHPGHLDWADYARLPANPAPGCLSLVRKQKPSLETSLAWNLIVLPQPSLAEIQ